MMRWQLATLSLTVLALTHAVRAAETPLSELVAGSPEVISEGHTFTEGPTWHPSGYLLFSDIPEARIHKVDQDGKVAVWWDASGGTNGLHCTADGVLYACQNRSGKLIRLSEGPLSSVVLAEEFAGKSLNSPNDLAIDSHSGVYFTDPVYGDRPQPQPVQGVYYFSNDNVLTRVIEDIDRPNGVNVSLDGRSLYVADADHSRILKYEITGPGELGPKTVFFEGNKEQDGHGPDGMAFDSKGNLYATMATTVVISPAGERIGEIKTPTKPANCTFGGADGKTLFITGKDKVYRVSMNVTGQPLPAHGPTGVRIAANNKQTTYFVQAETEAKAKEVVLRDLKLTIPSDWNETPSASRMRLATYIVPAAEGDKLPVDYVIFPPMGGSVQANVERWIGQFSGEKTTKVTKGKSEAGEYVIADITGTYNMPVGPPIMRKTEAVEGCRMLAAIITVPGGGSYYVKMAGPAATVAKAADGFRASFGADAEKETEFKLE